MGSGTYSEPIFVRHSDGKVYEYFIEANPIGNDCVDLCRQLVEDNGNRDLKYPATKTERLGDGFECAGGEVLGGYQ